MNYTDRLEGFQIRDTVYIGFPPPNATPEYDIVKWNSCEPREVYDFYGNKTIMSEYCYSVAKLKWDAKEKAFDFQSVGLRWLESKPSDAVIKMVMDFALTKEKELANPSFFQE